MIEQLKQVNEGRRKKRSLGEFDDHTAAQRQDAVKAIAETWFKHLGSCSRP